MKKLYKISETIFAVLLYSITLFLFLQNTQTNRASDTQIHSSENHNFFEAVPAEFEGIPLTEEFVVNFFSGARSSNPDFHGKAFAAYLNYCEKTIASSFVQYTFEVYSFPVKLRKSDLLFPFHYFW